MRTLRDVSVNSSGSWVECDHAELIAKAGTNERQRLCSGAAREARCSETIAVGCGGCVFLDRSAARTAPAQSRFARLSGFS